MAAPSKGRIPRLPPFADDQEKFFKLKALLQPLEHSILHNKGRRSPSAAELHHSINILQCALLFVDQARRTAL